ncbi:hypothetical protein cand_020090 [Cryptosporidium andersoni]|uniref:Ubiquitin-related modifier 1 homolog n=1 Tax=Cryptosporidium andersoni TaxID=117008 RepID=A0A1J4MV53_9CRYT|nr:hypothetical protein cand_020090 [Cryptosporidium andersoni]
MKVRLEFTGGLELLTGNKSIFDLDWLEEDSFSMKKLISYIKDTVIESRKDYFIDSDVKIKPGIIVLVNNCDWDIVGGENYQVKDGDLVTFISTLHGG